MHKATETWTTLLGNLLKLMGRTYRQTLSEDDVATYAEWCKDIPERELESCFRQAMEGSPQFMPTGAAISAIWKAREVKADTLAADQEWDRIVKHVDHNICAYEHDTPKGISDAAAYALRQIGGIEALWRVMLDQDEPQTRWLGKSFREAYNRHAETGGLKAIGRAEARRMLQLVHDARKQIEAGPKGVA